VRRPNNPEDFSGLFRPLFFTLTILLSTRPGILKLITFFLSFNAKSPSKGTELQERTRVCALIGVDTWVRPYQKIVT